MTATKPKTKQATRGATPPRANTARANTARANTERATTPHWRKPPPDLVALFDAALPDDPRVERRQMFGCPCAFAGGHLFAGVHQEDVMVRLGAAERTKLLAVAGARPFEPMPGRTMREYVVLPPRLHGEARALRRWIALALEYVVQLPAKPGRRKRALPNDEARKRRSA